MERAAIEEAVRLGGLSLPPDADIQITGEDPVYATPFRLGEGAAVAVALTGIAASEIWRRRTGRGQSVAVDVPHAAAALTNYHHLRLLDGEAPAQRPRGVGITAIHECRDGRFVHLHGSFRDTPGILEILGLPEDAATDHEAIAGAVRRWDAADLERALIAQRLCGVMVRANQEWLAHPQGQDLASRPLVEIIKIGEAPPQPLPEGSRPLSGVRVLDLTRVLAGPTVARTLAEHGADVLHIASPKLPTSAMFDIDTGHGKRQAWIDLDEPEQAERLRELTREADVFSQGYRKGALARRGFSPEEVAALRPGIVYVSENCYGHEGIWAERPGWEQLAQAATGVAAVQGGEGKPRLTGAAMNDYTTGYLGAYGAMVALLRRATEGGSWHVRVSLSRTSMWYYALGQDQDREAARGFGDIEALLDERADSPFGRMRYLRSPLRMSETQPHWTLPPSPLGAHEPAWMPR